MSEAYPQPTYQPMSETGIRKQEQSLNQIQRDRRDFDLDVEREYKRQVAARLDDSVMVKIEYVDPSREKRKEPLVMSIGTAYYGFWRLPRNGRNLAAWQEWMPAGSALPRCDGYPAKWRLMYDPRGVVPVPNIDDIRAKMEAERDGKAAEAPAPVEAAPQQAAEQAPATKPRQSKPRKASARKATTRKRS